ncbi:alpha-N-arabinofuranosidase (plasmid) [Saccharobesus litoralis]|uniref:Alpha-N-arabinofuranosidase n=1 Tax=Saccharobesus litoralis TaxID=2172099 RepID=A0A2S0VY57_9ALTE|nr:glycoside hydrolase family 43 protein [Saccharobesus litoralis]AWB69144.1 alpha-N-arabinofuranosidase [Saccharobesus litoralis]
MSLVKPLIEQRADPFIFKHSDGYYYFTASVPAYDCIEIRKARSIAELKHAEPSIAWCKPDTGEYSELIWAPELHFVDGSWYVYFAAAPSREIVDGLFQHRMYVLRCDDADPTTGDWQFVGKIDTGIDSFCLDATVFYHKGILYYLWAQKENEITGNSNLYIAPMASPTEISGKPVLISKPEFDWEIRGFWVNEGPAVLKGNGKIFVSYSASATDENYCMGLLSIDENADLLEPANWVKTESPVFKTVSEAKMFGPGHNSFTKSECGQHDMLVFHARNYTEIEGDPLWNPDRHTFVKKITWNAQGEPVFGTPADLEDLVSG